MKRDQDSGCSHWPPTAQWKFKDLAAQWIVHLADVSLSCNYHTKLEMLSDLISASTNELNIA